MCLLRLAFRVNSESHWLHLKAFSVLCVLMCPVSVFLFLNVAPAKWKKYINNCLNFWWILSSPWFGTKFQNITTHHILDRKKMPRKKYAKLHGLSNGPSFGKFLSNSGKYIWSRKKAHVFSDVVLNYGTTWKFAHILDTYNYDQVHVCAYAKSSALWT